MGRGSSLIKSGKMRDPGEEEDMCDRNLGVNKVQGTGKSLNVIKYISVK